MKKIHILLIAILACANMLMESCSNTDKSARQLEGTWQLTGIQLRKGYEMAKDDSMGFALANLGLALHGFNKLYLRGDSMFFDESFQGVYRVQDTFLYLTNNGEVDTQIYEVRNDSLFLNETGSDGALAFAREK